MLARVALDRGPGLPSLAALVATAVVAALAAYLRQVGALARLEIRRQAHPGAPNPSTMYLRILVSKNCRLEHVIRIQLLPWRVEKHPLAWGRCDLTS